MRFKRFLYTLNHFFQFPRDVKYEFFDKRIKKEGIILVSHDAQNLGASILLLHLAEALVELGENVYIISLNCGELNFNYHSIAPTEICMSKIKYKLLIKKLNRDYNYKRLIANTVVTGEHARIASNHGYEVISLVHELGEVIKQINCEKDAKDAIEFSDVTVFSTKVAKNEVLELTGAKPKKTVIRPQGVYYSKPEKEIIKKEQELLINKYPQIKDKKIIIGVGNTTYRKGFDLFIETAMKLPNYIFLWAGAKENHYTKIVNKFDKIPYNFIYLGKMNSNQLSAVYSLASIMLMSARNDTLPSTIFESLMFNVPIIGGKTSGGIIDIIDDTNGLLTDEISADAFARAIDYMISSDSISTVKKQMTNSNGFGYSMQEYVKYLVDLF